MKKATKSQQIAALTADNEALRQTVNRLSLVIAATVQAARGSGTMKGDPIGDEPAVRSAREVYDIFRRQLNSRDHFIGQMKAKLEDAQAHVKRCDELMSRAAKQIGLLEAGITRRNKMTELVQAVINDIAREQPDFQIPRTLDTVLAALVVANIG